MKISDAIRDQFDASDRSKGKLYADWNYAKIISTGENFIKAEVSGSHRNKYDVSIVADPKEVIVECSCPYFKSTGACKHIWATIITAETRGFNCDLITSPVLLIEKDLLDDDDDDDDDEDDDEDSFFGDDTPAFDALKKVFKDKSSGLTQRKGFKHLNNFTKKGSSYIKPAPNWKSLFTLTGVYDSQNSSFGTTDEQWEVFYEINASDKVSLQDIQISTFQRKLKKDGTYSQPTHLQLTTSSVSQIKNQTDRKILSMLLGANTFNYTSYSTNKINHDLAISVLPAMISTGRCYLSHSHANEKVLLQYDSSTKWDLSLSLEKEGEHYTLKANFVCETTTRAISEIRHISSTGFVFWNDGIVNPLDAHQLYAWIQNLIKDTYTIPSAEAKQFVLSFKGLRDKPPITIPEELEIREIHLEPKPLLRILDESMSRRGMMNAEVHFLYEQHIVKIYERANTLYDSTLGVIYTVNWQFQSDCIDTLHDLGITEDPWYKAQSLFSVKKTAIPHIVSELIDKGWKIEGKNVVFKKPGSFSFSVSSGIDWFELKGSCEYGDQMVSIPEILDALKKKKDFIELDNGECGLLPVEWLEKYSKLAKMGTIDDDSIKFRKSQALLVDLLVADQPLVNCDAFFTSARNSLRDFSGISEEQESSSFSGTLRNYQREGLGWLSFLQKFGFGGCLADDMGLGKTIQVLALLEKQTIPAEKKKTTARKKGENKVAVLNNKKPSLVVAPRSLIYNWNCEATKFAPKLKVLDYSHSLRTIETPDFSNYDIVLVTYGTLIRDIEFLSSVPFNYVILDEAQAIKNAATVTAKSARLLNGEHRLALSGTPVENHLGDLWSIFEFLNPGILGTASVFKGSTGAKVPDESECELLRKVLRPFILRRTKAQVATDLPEKTEELIICEMDTAQKKVYDQMKKFYQQSLMATINKSGLNRSKIHILEALLRLRQVACHPGLVEKKHASLPSAKLETLIAQLLELKEEGHKCLVFSQFTSMLAIIRDSLEKAGISYEYLDGQTRNRQQVIDNFQNDPKHTAFLISLKAGGVGLNLTAADYVFIFDPWWNPAAEMQAIDRTHRIGQTKPVFAYRLICKDTVEEKIMELQKSKRFLAESVISTDESILGSITQDDLELLLG